MEYPRCALSSLRASHWPRLTGRRSQPRTSEGALGARLSQLEEQDYNLKRQELDALIAQRLLAQEAAKRGISAAALLDAEETAKVGLVTENEIETFYQANKTRVRGEESAGQRVHDLVLKLLPTG